MKQRRLIWLLLAGAVGWPVCTTASELTTCADVRDLFKSPLPPASSYPRVEVLEKAVAVLQQEGAPVSDGCDDWVVERTYRDHADALDKFSQTFAGDPNATQTWARDAAAAYGRHLDWFLALTDSRQDALVRLLLKMQRAQDQEFMKEKRTWLRTRIGNVLNSMGAAYVRAQAWDELLDAYEKYFRQSIEIFPNEVATKWHKWLRSLPDFKVEKRDAQIKNLIADSPDGHNRWSAFNDFLGAFLPINPSVQGQWGGIRQRLTQWLTM